MKITKKEYSVLYWIIRNGVTDFDRLSIKIDLEKAKIIINNLEKKKLIKINYRNSKIYGFMETELGNVILEDKKYEKWFIELGD